MVQEGRWSTLRQFVDWWWRASTPCRIPDECFRQHRGSHEFVLYREGQFQVEQITLYPGYEVPAHTHPDVDTVETHLMGGGLAWVGGRRIPEQADTRHDPRYRRLLIRAGTTHRGVASTVNVALSFQRWRRPAVPTFITDNWRGTPWAE